MQSTTNESSKHCLKIEDRRTQSMACKYAQEHSNECNYGRGPLGHVNTYSYVRKNKQWIHSTTDNRIRLNANTCNDIPKLCIALNMQNIMKHLKLSIDVHMHSSKRRYMQTIRKSTFTTFTDYHIIATFKIDACTQTHSKHSQNYMEL